MRVGLIGCGRIANQAHAAAYSAADVQVTAVCDLDPARAAAMADRLGCPVAPTAQALARRGDVDLIDVATDPGGRADLLRSLFGVGKPILSQKPLTYDVSTASALVSEAARAGVVLAVNHNARWAPTHLEVYRRLLAGDLGHVYAIAHHNRFSENVDTWYTRHRDYLFLDHGIHYFDLVRVLTGQNPTAVSTTAATFPGQLPAGPIMHSTQLRFADPATPHVVLTFVNAVPVPDGFDYRLILDGTLASLRAGLTSIDYLPHPAAGPTRPAARDQPVPGDWVPDGFVGALNAVVAHLCHDGPLPHSAADHLASLAVATAAARSARHRGAWTTVDLPPHLADRPGHGEQAPEVNDGEATAASLRDYLL